MNVGLLVERELGPGERCDTRSGDIVYSAEWLNVSNDLAAIESEAVSCEAVEAVESLRRLRLDGGLSRRLNAPHERRWL
jgi:hypothetical protein